MPFRARLADIIARRRDKSVHDPQPSGVMRLPLEIRQQIYRHLLVESKPIRAVFFPKRWLFDDFWRHATRDTAIFLVSRQTSAEALDIFYGENVFLVTLHGGEENVFHRLSERCMHRIRRLQLVTRQLPHPYGKKSALKLDDETWPLILANLRELRLVLDDSWTDYYRRDGRFEKMIDEWARWLKPVFEYIDKHVREGLVIQINDNGEVGTSELAERCFTRAVYRKV